MSAEPSKAVLDDNPPMRELDTHGGNAFATPYVISRPDIPGVSSFLWRDQSDLLAQRRPPNLSST